MYNTCLAKGNPKRMLEGFLARSDYKLYTENCSTKPPSTKAPITRYPHDGGGCHSVTRTCLNASKARPMWLRHKRRRTQEVDEIR
jgi:hypothetical protein